MEKKPEGDESKESRNTLMMKWLLWMVIIWSSLAKGESASQTFEWQQKGKTEQSLEMPRRATLMKVVTYKEEAGESSTEKFQKKTKKCSVEKLGSMALVLFGGSACEERTCKKFVKQT